MANYELVKDDEFSGATVFINGETFTVASDNPNWEQIVTHLITNVDDDEKLKALIAPAQGAADSLLRVTERVTYVGGELFFDGDPLENALADHIIKIIEAGATKEDYTSFGNFLEKLAQNPSKRSRKHLYSFIETHGMTISPDGDLIAYKGVNRDGTSSHAGYGIVDGVVFEHAHLQNNIGSVIEIPRSRVDDDRNVGCSTGLHAGTYDYARSFAPRLLTVKVNPRDVVSVPKDHSNAKIRTCRYVVLEENDGKIDTLTYGETAQPDDDFAPDEDYGQPEESESDDFTGSEEPPATEEQEQDDTSDDALAEAIASAVKGSGAGAATTVNITVNVGRRADGKFTSENNPGKTQKRDAKGHFIKG